VTEPVVYEVTPEPGDDEGFRITRDAHFCTWHGSESEAMLEAVQLAVDEAVDRFAHNHARARARWPPEGRAALSGALRARGGLTATSCL
jgi:hypothetical protein